MEHILLFSSPDQPGIIARISSEIYSSGGNVLQSEQATLGGHFFLRFVFDGEDISDFLKKEFPGSSFSCQTKRKKKMVILSSKPRHCLVDLLWREKEGELNTETLAVISNVKETNEALTSFDVPFYFVPQGEDRLAGEQEILKKIPKETDLIVLARYMRILSGQFLEELSLPLINVHHSFLPAFPGAHPYRQAYDKGVKVIGATAHYVIEELDAGAIISQSVRGVDHRYSPEDLERVGKDQERVALAEAVAAHAEDRVINFNGKTVVFSA